MKSIKNLIAVAIILGASSQFAAASHFRGGALIPTIVDNGGQWQLMVESTTFWRKGAANALSTSVTGVAGIALVSQVSDVLDTSDGRYDRQVRTHTYDIENAGTYNISMGSCCRVASGGVGNWSESSWDLQSAIVWDGQNAANPIDFSFQTVQSQVSRTGSYSDNLDASSPDGHVLSYDQALNLNITAQPPGFSIDPTTGQMTIVAGTPGAADYADNSAFNLGADAAFSGNITTRDGDRVEFDWMFDGVDGTVNQAPNVDDAVINALAGDMVMHTFTATDPEGDALIWTPNLALDIVLGGDFIGWGGAAPMWNPATQQFTWDSTGANVGDQFIYQVRAFDDPEPDGIGNLGDFGALTINIINGQPDPCIANPQLPGCPTTPVPEPTTLALIGLGLLGLRLRKSLK